jgi:hypothetical protein
MLLTIIGFGFAYVLINIYAMINSLPSISNLKLTDKVIGHSKLQQMENSKNHNFKRMSNESNQVNPVLAPAVQANLPVNPPSVPPIQPNLPVNPPVKSSNPIEIKVQIATGHFLGNFHGNIEPCNSLIDNQPIKCIWLPEWTKDPNADAYWYHGPTMGSVPDNNNYKIFFTMESAAYYGQINDKGLLSKFNMKYTYELDSQVVAIYPPYDIRKKPSIPNFDSRKAALVFLNRNCGAQNGRHMIIQTLMKTIKVDAPSACLHNVDMPTDSKESVFEQYRVCSAIENSNAKDYVTEKLWDAYRDGCVPIYLGAPNLLTDFAPSNDSLIMVQNYIKDSNDVEGIKALGAEIEAVYTDKKVWEKYMAWRNRPFDQLNAGYRNILRLQDKGETKCQVCQLLAMNKKKT